MKSWKRHSNKRAVDGDASTSKAEDSFFGNKIKETRKQLKSTLFGSRAPRSRGTTLEDTSVFVTHSGEEPECKSIKDAVRFGKPDELRKRINADNVDKPVTDGLRVSDLAAALGNIQFLQVVIDNNAQINTKNSANQLPIHYALTSPDPAATVAFLLECGAVTDIPFPNGDFLMHKACSESSTALLELLLSHDSSLDCVDHMKLTPLHRASINDLKDHCEIIIQAAPHLVNEQDRDGRTPLHIAVSNQSIQLMKILLDRGAAIDKETIEGLTPIDLMMASKNRGALRELIFYFTDKVSKDVKAYKVQELYRSKHFHKFLSLLQLIDSDTHKCYYRSPDEKLESAEEQKLIDELLDLDEERLQDVIEFQSKVMAALRTNAIHEQTDNREVIDTIAIFTTKYILFREDVALLQEVMRCGVVWQKVRSFLEQHISTLYTKTNKESSLISKLFVENFLDIAGKKKSVSLKKISQQVVQGIGLPPSAAQSVSEENVLEVRFPVKTLVIWSILTGHLNFTLLFLRRVEFEIIPMCLLAAGILRKLFYILGQGQMNEQAVTDLALECEQMACDVIKKAMLIDSSDDKLVTYKYLLQRMPAFGDLNCIHLAANCQCDTFLTLDVSQKAMDLMWYRYISEMGAWNRQLVVVMGLIPFNPLVPTLLYALTKKSSSGEEEVADNMHSSKESFVIKEAEDATDTMLRHDVTNEVQVRNSCWSHVVYSLGLYYYFYQIPSVKFQYITLSHITLILIMSYVLLIDFMQQMQLLEMCVYTIAVGLLVEELREIVRAAWSGNYREYFSNKWNIFDCLSSLFLFIAFCLRLYMQLRPDQVIEFNALFDNNIWFIARTFFGFACLLLWVKLLNVVRVYEYFGPKLTMISDMIIRDLLPFMFILGVFVCSFGVLMCSLMHPNGHFAYNPQPQSTGEILKQMLHIGFYSIFGEYHLEVMTGADCDEVYERRSNSSSSCPHPNSTFLVPYVLLPVYITITTILLLSLIVALFSKTIDQIDSNSRALWLFERFAFVNEYENYSALPPPLNLLDIAREALISLCSSRLPRNPVEAHMDFFDQQAVVRHLINQAIGLRNFRRQQQLQQQQQEKDDDDGNGKVALLNELRKLMQKLQLQCE